MLDLLSDEIELDIKVFVPRGDHVIFLEIDGRFVVAPECCRNGGWKEREAVEEGPGP